MQRRVTLILSAMMTIAVAGILAGTFWYGWNGDSGEKVAGPSAAICRG